MKDNNYYTMKESKNIFRCLFLLDKKDHKNLYNYIEYLNNFSNKYEYIIDKYNIKEFIRILPKKDISIGDMLSIGLGNEDFYNRKEIQAKWNKRKLERMLTIKNDVKEKKVKI